VNHPEAGKGRQRKKTKEKSAFLRGVDWWNFNWEIPGMAGLKKKHKGK